MTEIELSADEHHLLAYLTAQARLVELTVNPETTRWRYHGQAALLLAVGRLFTVAAWPPDGQAQRCWHNATYYAEDHREAVYVEGYAVHPGLAALGLETPHAWCADSTTGIEPTPGWAGGAAYLGVPLADDYRRHLQRKHGIGPLITGEHVIAMEIYRDGLPADALADVGRPLPAFAIDNDATVRTDH